MPRLSRVLVLFTYLLFVSGKNEVLNKAIVVTAPRAECTNLFPPNCIKPTAFAKVDAAHVPPNYQCPCPVTNAGDQTGGIIGPLGVPVAPNDDAAFFVDEVLANGFDNPIAVTFADSTQQMFVGERGGRIWHVDLSTGEKKIFVDLSADVGFSGDRGLMDVKCHPNYANVHQLLIMYTVDGNPGDGVEPDAESAQNQRIIRLGEQNGVWNNYKLNVIGGGAADGVPICFNTHALGAMQFGQDGSLIVTTGEGAHWNFDMGDWGQDASGRVDPLYGNRTESLDAQCRALFGAQQDVGAWRSQVLFSLSGKVLRIAPNSGDGICPGSETGGGYEINNPYCDTSNGTSIRSKIWAIGLRNPFRMTMRPFNPIRDKNPGVFYFGDVGQGGYEEVNAVTKPGMNFGWPCWEGPLPCPIYRDSNYNDDANYNFTKGCGGSATVIAPCNPITTIAYDENGSRFTCPYVYNNKNTTLPFMYWTRYRPGDNAGYFTENAITGQKFFGATTAGLTFYKGTKYPEKYWGQLFALDFTEKWVKVLYSDDGDNYVKTEDFADLIYSEPKEGAKVTLESGPDGNICYLTLNGGEVRCFRYVNVNVAPTPVPGAVDNTGNGANTVIQFKSDSTFDRERDEMLFSWNFGDGATSNLANPAHTYSVPGVYNVSLSCKDKFDNDATAYYTVYTNNKRPVVTITSPTPTFANVFVLQQNQPVTFDLSVVDDGPTNTLTYQWEYQFVHNSHFHEKVKLFNTKTFVEPNPPDESAFERNNLRVIARVTDAGGLVGSASIYISRSDWLTAFGNRAPVADFIYKSVSPVRVGQPIQFDARGTVDLDGDQITYVWTWGDGLKGDGLISTHTYDTPNPTGYTVTLNVTDNWGYSTAKTLNVPVLSRQALEPVCGAPSGAVYESFTVELSSVEPGAIIYYELFQGDSTGIDVTPCSPQYTAPIVVPYVPNVNVTLLVKASNGGVPSSTGRYLYQMLHPPCEKLGFGPSVAGPPGGNLFCINTVASPTPAANISIPVKNPADNPWTEGPPADNTKIISWTATLLNGNYDTSRGSNDNTTIPNLWVNQGSSVGAILKVRVSYDFTGDGTWDRVETFDNVGPNDVATDFEIFNFPNPVSRLPNPGSLTGSTTYNPLVNGTIWVQFWEAINRISGVNPLSVRIGAGVTDSKGMVQYSFVRLPYANIYQYVPLVNNGTLSGPVNRQCTGSWASQAVATTGSATTGRAVGTSNDNPGANSSSASTVVVGVLAILLALFTL